MDISNSSITELSVAIIGVLSALGICLNRCIAQIEQSRCSKIKCCGIEIARTPTENVEIITEN